MRSDVPRLKVRVKVRADCLMWSRPCMLILNFDSKDLLSIYIYFNFTVVALLYKSFLADSINCSLLTQYGWDAVSERAYSRSYNDTDISVYCGIWGIYYVTCEEFFPVKTKCVKQNLNALHHCSRSGNHDWKFLFSKSCDVLCVRYFRKEIVEKTTI